MQPSNDEHIFNSLQDLVQGFTNFNGLYIKHFDFRDELALRKYYEDKLESLTEIPKEKDQLKMLIGKGIWKGTQEGELNVKKVRLEAAKTTLPNLLIESQRKPLEKQIVELKEEVSKLEGEKSEYMGITREDVANTHSYDYVLYLSVFNDKDYKEPTFPDKDKDLDELDPNELVLIQAAVGGVRGMCGVDNCKKVACSYYVQSMVNCLPEDHEYQLVNRPIHELTVSQINLIQYCSVFRKIFNKYTIPEDIAKDPDKILEFPKKAQKLEDLRQKNAGSQDVGSGKTYVGASSEEMKDMGMRGVDIHHLLNKSGKKSLGKEDLL